MPEQTLVPAEAEASVIDELNIRLPLLAFVVDVATKIPNPRPDDFVRVIVAGGTPRDLVADQWIVTVEGWSTREARAERLCSTAVAALQAAGRAGTVGSAVCYGVSVFGLPANLPHPSVTDRYRYTSSVQVALRRTVA